MATANQYATNGAPQANDLVLTYSTNNADTRKLSLSALAAWITSYVGANPTTPQKQYYSPASTGFTVAISPTVNGNNVWLLMTPTGTLAAGTITLPLSTTCADGQFVRVTSTQTVTTLTIAGNGATATLGAPTTIAANGYFTLAFDKVNNFWVRIG